MTSQQRPNSRVQCVCVCVWGGGGGGGGCTLNTTRNNATDFRFMCQKTESTTNRHKSRDQKKGLKLWTLQSYIWRPGDKVQNLDTPGLYGRADSPAKPARMIFCFFLLGHFNIFNFTCVFLENKNISSLVFSTSSAD